MPDLNIGSISLGEHDRDWFMVMSKLSGRSLRANASNIIECYVRQRKDNYQELLAYTARKYGLTTDECFEKLLRGEELGTPIENFSEQPPNNEK